MYYGYDHTTKGWKPERRSLLNEAIGHLIREFNAKHKPTRGYENYTAQLGTTVFDPESVAIRRVTHFTDEERDELTAKADKIYDSIMLT